MSTDAHMQAFVQQVLSDFAEEWQQAAKERLAGRNIRASEDLLQSVSAKALPGMVQALFADQGRFHDMGAGRGYTKGKFTGTDDRAEFLKGRKPSNWYSKLTWGKVYGAGGLVDLLSNAYVREVPGQLVQEFKKG
jgi:hypothetical protein